MNTYYLLNFSHWKTNGSYEETKNKIKIDITVNNSIAVLSFFIHVLHTKAKYMREKKSGLLFKR